jgi:hypothetical protein
MRDQGKYQLQLMKTRSSSGVGQKIELGFNVDTLRITDPDPEGNNEADIFVPESTPDQILNKIRPQSTINTAVVEDKPIGNVTINDKQAETLQNLLGDIRKRFHKS